MCKKVLQRYRFVAIFSINHAKFTLMSKSNYNVIGVMSGTSLDGIDLAHISFRISEGGSWDFTILQAETMAYTSEWKTRLQEGIHFSQGRLQSLDETYTRYLAQCIQEFITTHQIDHLDAVCSHGHTIKHRPDLGYSLQIGNRAELAQKIGQQVVCDFRVQDVAMGGQGAPLVPIGDRLLFGDYTHCLNLGGFANVSFEGNDGRIAYDICPVNIVLNPWAEKLGAPYDAAGQWASEGKLHIDLLEALNSLDYYQSPPPKSLGLEWVQQQFNPLLSTYKLSPKDTLRTLVEHMAVQLSQTFDPQSKVLVTGGGAYNDFLLQRTQLLSGAQLIQPAPEIIEFKEAVVFGLLGVLKLRGEVNCLASVTGASQDHSSGVVFHPEN